jgi:hypothetical protein
MMGYRRISVFSFLVLGAIVASAATAGTAQQWDVPDYTKLSIKSTTAPIETETTLLDALAANFDAIDTNHDGKVSFAEAQTALPGLTLAVFELVDTNHNGFITRNEVERCEVCNRLSFFGLGDICRTLLSFFGGLFGGLFSHRHW